MGQLLCKPKLEEVNDKVNNNTSRALLITVENDKETGNGTRNIKSSPICSEKSETIESVSTAAPSPTSSHSEKSNGQAKQKHANDTVVDEPDEAHLVAYRQAEADRVVKEQQVAKQKLDQELKEEHEKEQALKKAAEEKLQMEARVKLESDAKEKEQIEAASKAERVAKENHEKEQRLLKAAEEKIQREAIEKAERDVKEKAEHEATAKAEREAKEIAEKAERDIKEKAENEAIAKAEREANEIAEKAERDVKEKAENEAIAKAEREANGIAELEAKLSVEEAKKEDAKRKKSTLPQCRDKSQDFANSTKKGGDQSTHTICVSNLKIHQTAKFSIMDVPNAKFRTQIHESEVSISPQTRAEIKTLTSCNPALCYYYTPRFSILGLLPK